MSKNNVPETRFSELDLGDGGSVRYERPSDQICDLISGYHLYRAPRAEARADWFLPGTANIRISWYGKPIAIRIGDRRFEHLPRCALFGPTSRPVKARTHGGLMIGIGVSALGWSRFFDQSAADVADAIVPLEHTWSAEASNTLCGLLQDHDLTQPVAPLLDRFLLRRLLRKRHDEALLAQMARLIVDEDITRVFDVVNAMGIKENRVRRLAHRYFGFSPRTLLRRAKFLRSIIAVSGPARGPISRVIAESYFDQSHFIREARHVLGMTPKQFAELDQPFLAASIELRPRVLGSVTQALQPIDR